MEEPMTFKRLCEIVEANKIPHDVRFMSDSGWECGPTDMCGMFYSKKENTIIFTQGKPSLYIDRREDEDWALLAGKWRSY